MCYRKCLKGCILWILSSPTLDITGICEERSSLSIQELELCSLKCMQGEPSTGMFPDHAHRQPALDHPGTHLFLCQQPYIHWQGHLAATQQHP